MVFRHMDNIYLLSVWRKATETIESCRFHFFFQLFFLAEFSFFAAVVAVRMLYDEKPAVAA